MRMGMVQRPIYTYQGATVQLVDPIDFFWTSDKRELYDEHPLMIRTMVSEHWLKQQPWLVAGSLNKLKAFYSGQTNDLDEELLDERREYLGFNRGTDMNSNRKYEYVEWHGYCDLNSDGKQLFILGVVDGRVLVRVQNAEETFGLGHPNIVVGRIGEETGEIYGPSLVDKIHSVQHGMDSLMGVWLKALRQTGNPMWVGDSDRMKSRTIVNEAGVFIDVRSGERGIDSAIKRVEPQQISQDVYDGLAMFRKMGQNASGISDIASGIVQQGVETLGEADILAGQSALRLKGGYLRCFEKSFIKPIWEMRNQVNMKYCTDPGYLYSILEDGIMYWRQATPEQIKAGVDFVCEASNRENQRNVVTQQILQAVNLTSAAIPVLGPLPFLKLLEKLYSDGFGWKQDTIRELLPLDIITNQMVASQAAQNQPPGGNPGNMPQPKSEGDAEQSARQQFSTPVGEVG